MSEVKTSAGSTISIVNSLPATFNAAGYDALTFKEIGEVVSIGEMGKKFNIVQHKPLKDRQIIKRKGSYDNGSVPIGYARHSADAGQVEALAALDLDTSSSFMITLQGGDKQYFTAQISSMTTNVGSVDDITGGTINVEIDRNIIEA